MSNEQYTNALERKIEIFKKDFLSFSRDQYTKDGKLIHAGEFGSSREKISQQLIESVIPKSRDIDTHGFVINSRNEISKEQDLIFFSKNDTAVLTLENTKFFPVETVVAVGQIKSIIRNKKDLKEALDELKSIKSLRENMGHTSVIWRGQDLFGGRNSYSKDNPYDQVFTFLICEKIDFELSELDLDDLYDKETPNHLKHNILLDINSGVFAYKIKVDEPFVAMPFTSKGISIPHFEIADQKNSHIKHFLINLQTFIPGSTIFHPEMGLYVEFR